MMKDLDMICTPCLDCVNCVRLLAFVILLDHYFCEHFRHIFFVCCPIYVKFIRSKEDPESGRGPNGLLNSVLSLMGFKAFYINY